METLLNFYQNYTFLFWIIFTIIILIVIFIFYFFTDTEEQKAIEKHNLTIAEETKKQLLNIENWKGKMINILSSNIAESCYIQEVVCYESKVKIVLQGHQEFIVMHLPYTMEEKTVKARGKLINPNEQPVETNPTLNSVKEFIKSPTGFGLGTTIIGNIAPVLAGPFGMAWATLNSEQKEDNIQFVFTE